MHMLINGTTEYRVESRGILLEMVKDLNEVIKDKSPSVMTTHLPYRCLPKNHVINGGKIVHVRRNPKDVNVSFYHFLKTVTMPGTDFFNNIRDMTWDQFFNNLVAIEGNYAGRRYILYNYRNVQC